MPVTPNRSYPYPASTDPARVPFYTQTLAEAIDNDLEGRDAVIATRPYAKIRGTATTYVSSGGSTTVLPFDVEDFDTDNMADLSLNRQALTIQHAGFYWVHARIRLYATGFIPPSPFWIVTIQINGTTPLTVGRYHQIPLSPVYFDATISAGRAFVVGDTLTLTLAHNIDADTQISRFRELTAFRTSN